MSSDYSGEVVEIEVARYGLRTFRHIPAEEAEMEPKPFVMHQTLQMTWTIFGVDYSQDNTGQPMELCSTAMQGSYWKSGVCEAVCRAPVNAHKNLLIELAALTTGVEPVYGHQAPQEDCHCGVYAAHTLRALCDQFSCYVSDVVAVVAAEGQTIIGDKGFRTQRARVVAYWCSDRVAPTAASQFSEAQRYAEVSLMLADYGLDEGRPTPAERLWPNLQRSPAEEASTRSGYRKYAGVGGNFAASALNFALFAASHSLWTLGFAVAGLAFGVCLLLVVVNK
jgi:hypothetical protein